MEIEEALQALHRAGLVARFLGGRDQRIMGGRRHKGWLVEDAFAIFESEQGWIFALPGPGQLATEHHAPTLEDAVNLAIAHYQRG